MKTEIVFFNPPFNRIKADYVSEASLNRFEMDAINPGILSMATYLRKKGVGVEIFDFYREKNIRLVEKEIAEILRQKHPSIVGISNLSAYDYLDTLRLSRLVKKLNPNIFILVGGQHASGLKSLVLRDEQCVDGLIEGQGELAILDLYSKIKLKKDLFGTRNLWLRDGKGIILPPSSYASPIFLEEIPPLDFPMYPNARSFTPFIEESRGCHLGCKYCNNSSFYKRGVQAKSAEKFSIDANSTISFFGKDVLYAVMTSNFTYKESSKKLKELKKQGIRWSTEISCDIPWYTKVWALGQSGMFLLNVGFESASSETLIRMNKTKNPSKYLENAQRILDKAERCRAMKTRFNIMIYPGDTLENIKMTEHFLSKNAGKLDAVVCCPTIAYPGSELYEELDKIEDKYGALRVATFFCESTHHYPIHPSKDISFEKATEVCLDLEKKFSSLRMLSLQHNYKKYEGRI